MCYEWLISHGRNMLLLDLLTFLLQGPCLSCWANRKVKLIATGKLGNMDSAFTSGAGVMNYFGLTIKAHNSSFKTALMIPYTFGRCFGKWQCHTDPISICLQHHRLQNQKGLSRQSWWPRSVVIWETQILWKYCEQSSWRNTTAGVKWWAPVPSAVIRAAQARYPQSHGSAPAASGTVSHPKVVGGLLAPFPTSCSFQGFSS